MIEQIKNMDFAKRDDIPLENQKEIKSNLLKASKREPTIPPEKALDRLLQKRRGGYLRGDNFINILIRLLYTGRIKSTELTCIVRLIIKK